MKRYKAVVWRTMSATVEFNENEVPEMIDPMGKAEWLSRQPDLDWKLEDVSPEIVEVSNVE